MEEVREEGKERGEDWVVKGRGGEGGKACE